MNLTLWVDFKKRINSTKRPTTTGESYECKLKTPTATIAPVFILKPDNVLKSYNYFLFNGKYYYVTEKQIVNNEIIEITGMVDALATYRADILASNFFVQYATKGYNTMITDGRLSMVNTAQHFNSAQFVFPQISENGYYIFSTAAYSPPAQTGLTSSYAMEGSVISALGDRLYENSVWEEIKNFFADPYEGMISCHWVPFFTAGEATEIMVGKYGIGLSANGLTTDFNSPLCSTYDINLPMNMGDFRDYPPFSKHVLHLPFIGDVTLNPALLTDTVTVEVHRDCVSGGVSYNIKSSDKFQDVSFQTVAAVPVAVGHAQGHILEGIGQIASGVLDLASQISPAGKLAQVNDLLGGGGGGNGVSQIGEGIITTFSQDVGARGCNGSISSISRYLSAPYNQIYCTQYIHDVSAAPSSLGATNGRPVFAMRTLSTLNNGYVQTAGASIHCAGFDFEKAKINATLNGAGVYLE